VTPKDYERTTSIDRVDFDRESRLHMAPILTVGDILRTPDPQEKARLWKRWSIENEGHLALWGDK